MELGPRQLEWLEALESGDYEQTKKTLKDVDGFCCLGVACQISGLGEWKEPNTDIPEYTYYVSKDDWQRTILPKAVRDYFGFIGVAGDSISMELPELTVYNDKKEFTFKQIAAMIRKNPEQFFAESK